MKITFIGAGSIIFAKTLIIDILNFEDLRDCEICLMDINQERLSLIKQLTEKIIKINDKIATLYISQKSLIACLCWAVKAFI